MTVQILELCVIVALGWLLYRTHKHAVEALYDATEQHAAVTAACFQRFADLAAHAGQSDPHPDLTQTIALVDRLCQRIQAPDVAVTEHALAQPLPPMPQPAMPDDDDQFWADQGFAPSKEELAEQRMSAD